MNWYPLTRIDIAAILLMVAIAGGLLFVHVAVPNLFNPDQTFSPGWECTNPGEGDFVCIKKPGAK